ncbi:MAG: lipopolysaccharide heptosyltransferase I [Desulfobacterales bacterium]|nr:MAG: lipopolysaccharide heptosyltransferase I [Desulfobacterales bacterium]
MSAIGDVIHTLPALCALRRQYPEARITWLVEEAASGIIAGHPAIDRILVSRRKSWISALRKGPDRTAALREAAAFTDELRSEAYDLVLDFQQLFKSAVMVALSRGRIKAGFDRGLAHMEESHRALNVRVRPPSMEIHALDRYLDLVRAMGVPVSGVEYGLPESPDARQTAADQLRAGGWNGHPLIALNPVAMWETKCWSDEGFARVADALHRRFGVQTVWTGGPADRDRVEAICGRMREPSINLAGRTTLSELAALYRACRCLVTTDTGPMHLAAAVGTPVAAVFGPTAPWRTGPYGPGHWIVRGTAPCSPCFKRKCRHKDHPCMRSITPDAVLSAVARITGRKGALSSPVQHDFSFTCRDGLDKQETRILPMGVIADQCYK